MIACSILLGIGREVGTRRGDDLVKCMWASNCFTIARIALLGFPVEGDGEKVVKELLDHFDSAHHCWADSAKIDPKNNV